jgi:hypothetical protein
MIILGLLAIVFGLLLTARPVGRRVPSRTAPHALPDEPAPEALEPPEPLEALDAASVEEPTAPLAERPAPRPLRLGDSFSRAEIRALLGGSVQETFPHVGGRVVCGCFHPGYHPYAPFVVLPGFTPGIRRWAETLAAQAEPIPCFLKRAPNAWEYVGEFRVAALADDAEEVAEWARIAEREDDVSMVLHLEEA